MSAFSSTSMQSTLRFGINLKFWEHLSRTKTHRIPTAAAANVLADKIVDAFDKFEVVEPRKKSDLDKAYQDGRLEVIHRIGSKFKIRLEPKDGAKTDVEEVEYKFSRPSMGEDKEYFAVQFNNNTRFVYEGKTIQYKTQLIRLNQAIKQRFEFLKQQIAQGKLNQNNILERRAIFDMEEKLKDVRI